MLHLEMKGNVRKILWIIIFLFVLMVGSSITNTMVLLKESEQNKVWRSQHDKEMEAVKQYIKIVSDVDIDSAVSDQQVYNYMFQKLRDEYVPQPRGIKYIISSNNGK